MLIGYVRVSKSDGSQVLDLQKDALREAGVDEIRIYVDLASGRKDNRPGLKGCLHTTTLYMYVNGDGTPKEAGAKLLY